MVADRKTSTSPIQEFIGATEAIPPHTHTHTHTHGVDQQAQSVKS